MAVVDGSKSSVEVVKLLLKASVDITCLDVHGNLLVDLVYMVFGSSFSSKKEILGAFVKQ